MSMLARASRGLSSRGALRAWRTQDVVAYVSLFEMPVFRSVLMISG